MSNVNRKVIQILRSSKDYDPSTSEEILNDGELLYAKSNNQLYIGDNVNKLKDLNPITSYNLKDNEKGSLNQFSTISQDILFDGENYGLKKNDIIPGAKAMGYQSVAFGGLKYDCAGYHYIKLPIEITGTEGNYKTIYKYYDCEVGSYDEFSPPQIQLALTSYNADGTKDQSIYSNYGSEAIDIPFKYNTDTNQGEQIYTCTIRYATDIDHNPSKGIWKGKSIIIEGDGPFSKPIISTLYGSRTPTSAEGNQSFAAGASCHAYGDFSAAFNKDTRTYQRSSFAIGGSSQAGMTEEEFNEYYWDDANNIGLHGGSKNSEDVILDHEGKKYRDSHSFTLSGGANSKAFGPYSLAFGAKNTALGKSSAAFGQCTYALGDNSTAHGFGIEPENIEKYGILGANGKCSFVSGRSADAKGEFAHSLGYFTKADGKCSISVGDDSLAKGYCSISVGNGTYAGGNCSASFGLGEVSNHTVNNTLGALGNYSTHVGCKNIAGGTSSFASGQRTKALADYSFSSGCYSTIESGATASFASGSNNTIKGAKAFVAGESNTVEGTGSFAAGIGNTAGGYASVVLGRGLISNATGQFIAGQYNDENYLSSMAFAVGGGSNVDNVITRKNLLTLYKDGRLRLTQPTANLTDNDVPTLKCVKEEINSSMSKVESTIKDTMDLSKYDLTFIESLY